MKSKLTVVEKKRDNSINFGDLDIGSFFKLYMAIGTSTHICLKTSDDEFVEFEANSFKDGYVHTGSAREYETVCLVDADFTIRT